MTSVADVSLADLAKGLKAWADTIKELFELLSAVGKEMEKDFVRAQTLIQGVETCASKSWPKGKLSGRRQILFEALLKELREEEEVAK